MTTDKVAEREGHGIMPANLAHKLKAFAAEPEGTINWKMIAWSLHRMLNAKPLTHPAPKAEGREGEPNQCDGCVAGTPVRDGLHRDEQGRSYMTCQRDRYTHPAPEADAAAVPLAPTPGMIEAGAQRLVSWKDGCVWPDSWDALQVAAARNEAEWAWRSMWLAASPARGGEGEK